MAGLDFQVLPDDMLEFLDAPVPYIVGVKNKTSEVQSKLTNVIVVDILKNQVNFCLCSQYLLVMIFYGLF
jgi:hypothetical protein